MAMPDNAQDLDFEIKTYSATVSTNSYSMSVSELISMYNDYEIDLHPEFQRFFRWTIEQKSRLVESILLGIPIPPVFVSERDDSKWDIIDGLQRVSTLLELTGELRDEDGNVKDALVLTRTRYLPSLENKCWDSEDESLSLTEAAKIKIKRARLDINIIKNTSDQMAKFEIFQRLNTGGTKATDQEVRNCILIMTNRNFFFWVKSLSEYQSFRDCMSLSDRQIDESFDFELVSRFLVFTLCDDAILISIDELGSFLTNKIVDHAKDPLFEKDRVEKAFRSVFDFLSLTLGENSFKKYDVSKQRYQGATLISLFEVVASGLGNAVLKGIPLPDAEEFKRLHMGILDDPEVVKAIRPGVRASTRLSRTVKYGRTIFSV